MRNRLVIACVIVTLTVIFFIPVLFDGRTFLAFDTLLGCLPWSSLVERPDIHNTLISDPVNIFYPYYHFFKNGFEGRNLAFWDPSTFSGLPVSPPSNPAVLLFYFLFPQSVAHDLLLGIHLILTGLFTCLYLRSIGLGRFAALLGAVTWMFNGYAMVWFEFEHVVLLAPTLPASLYFMERFRENGSGIHILGMSLSIAYAISTHYAHLIIYQMLFLCAYGIYRWVFHEKALPIARYFTKRHAALALTAMALIACVSATFIVSHLFTLGDEQQRSSYTFRELYHQTGQLKAAYLPTLVFPDLFGNPARGLTLTPADRNAQPYNNYNELCIYFGIVPLLLSISGIMGWRGSSHVAFFMLVAATTLTMAMGSTLYYPLAKLIPGLNLSTPTRILYLFAFAACMLASFGAQAICEKQPLRSIRLMGAWGTVVAFSAFLAVFAQTNTGIAWLMSHTRFESLRPIESIIQAHFSLSNPIIYGPLFLLLISVVTLWMAMSDREYRSKRIFLILAFTLTAYDLMMFGNLYNSAPHRSLEFPETDGIRFLEKDPDVYRIMTFGSFMHNGLAPFGIQDAGGYTSFYPKRYGQYLYLGQKGEHTPLPDRFSRWVQFTAFGSPLLDLLNVKYVLTDPRIVNHTPKLELLYDGEIKIYRNKEAFPRAYFVSEYDLCSDQEQALLKLSEYTHKDFERKVILEGPLPEGFTDSGRKSPASDSEPLLAIMRYDGNQIEIDVTVGTDGFLVLCDSYHPGWRATVDGSPAQVIRANYVMRAVSVKAGRHRVVFTYHTPLRATFWITLFGWAGLCGITLTAVAKSRRGNGSPWCRKRL